jgi:hypothetical protein
MIPALKVDADGKHRILIVAFCMRVLRKARFLAANLKMLD